MFIFLFCNSVNFFCLIFEFFKNVVKINLLIFCKYVLYKLVIIYYVLWFMIWFDWLVLFFLYRLIYVGYVLFMKKFRVGILFFVLIKII